jgi:aspartate racemase
MAKRLGVIGGLGPLATAYFYELITRMTDAGSDQEHLEVYIISKPQIPDRTDYILGRSKNSPLEYLLKVGRTLDSMGADCIAMPCITAHYFHRELSEGIKAPIINIVNETAKYLKDHGTGTAGIMATEGTIRSGLFQNELVKYDIKPVIPSPDGQSLVTDIIYRNVKAGVPVNMDSFHAVTDELKKNGADTIILGCTELSMIKRDYPIGLGFIDALEVLAMCSITACGARLKKEYENLIT